MQVLERFHQKTPLYGRIALAAVCGIAGIAALTLANDALRDRAYDTIINNRACDPGEMAIMTNRWPLEYVCVQKPKPAPHIARVGKLPRDL